METCWYARPEWWLVILGFPTLVFVWLQAWWTRSAVKAAQASVEAFKNSERSWVMSDVIWAADTARAPRPTTMRVVFTSNNTGKKSFHILICLVCKNDGKTPAWITERSAWLNLFDDVPTNPDTNQPVAFTSSELVTLSVEQSDIIQCDVECDGPYPEIGGRGLVLYGVVRYRDAFGNHETWFGYTIHGDPGSHPQIDRLAGFPEYNKNA
jgi:hypothetical protein